MAGEERLPALPPNSAAPAMAAAFPSHLSLPPAQTLLSQEEDEAPALILSVTQRGSSNTESCSVHLSSP